MGVRHAFVSTLNTEWAEAAGKVSGNRWNEDHVADYTAGVSFSGTGAIDVTGSDGNFYQVQAQQAKIATPTFSPAAGSYSTAQSVTISCATSGAAIYYTTDGTSPTTGSTPYTGAISVSSTTTVKAIATKGGYADSSVGSATYTFMPTANLVARFKKNTGITSAGGFVSVWADQSGNGNDVSQGTGAKQPAVQGDGTILFDGIDDFLQSSAFTLNQPITVYMRVKLIAQSGAYQIMFDGNTADSQDFYVKPSSGTLGQYAGTLADSDATALSIGTWASVAAAFNGASSLCQNEASVGSAANAGASNAGGITFGANGGGSTQRANIQVAEAIVYSAAHDASTRAAVIAYLDTQ